MDSRRIIHLLSRTRDRIQKHFQRRIDGLKVGKIAPAHGSVLYALMDGPQAMQDLARLIERDTSTVTALADKLEKIGFAERTVAPHDTRSYLLALTPKGKLAAGKVIDASRGVVTRIFAGLSAAEREEFTRLLFKVYQNMEE
ncbi:MAG: MarR family transcriptional regulator [Leptospirales bacterium]|nr:MarR family transcriptional regulator [Leptospirales bacterium]